MTRLVEQNRETGSIYKPTPIWSIKFTKKVPIMQLAGERMGRQAPLLREVPLIHTVKQRQLSWAPGAREIGPAVSTDDPKDPQSTGGHQWKTE